MDAPEKEYFTIFGMLKVSELYNKVRPRVNYIRSSIDGAIQGNLERLGWAFIENENGRSRFWDSLSTMTDRIQDTDFERLMHELDDRSKNQAQDLNQQILHDIGFIINSFNELYDQIERGGRFSSGPQ